MNRPSRLRMAHPALAAFLTAAVLATTLASASAEPLQTGSARDRAAEMVYSEGDALVAALSRDGVAGWFFEEDGVVFAYTGLQSGIAELFSDPDLVSVRDVDYSLAELGAWGQSITEARDALRSVGSPLRYAGTDETNNKVTVALGAVNQDALAILGEIAPLGSLDVRESGPVTVARLEPASLSTSTSDSEILGQETCADRLACTPFRSGIQLMDSLGGYCTSGFVSNDSQGRRSILTNAHCGEVGDQFTHNGLVVGPISRAVEGNTTIVNNQIGWVDAALVRETSLAAQNWPVVYENGNDVDQHVNSISRTVLAGGVTYELPRLGENICKGGVRTGLSCGAVGPSYNYNSPYGTIAYRVPCATLSSNHGDSGSGMFYGSTAKGLLWGFIDADPADMPDNCGPGGTVFSPLDRVERALNSTTLLTSAGQR